MPCSPLLVGITDPAEVLAVLRDHPVLLYSEPPQTFRGLAERGWVEYGVGRWRITAEGRAAVPEVEEDPEDRPPHFFEL